MVKKCISQVPCTFFERPPRDTVSEIIRDVMIVPFHRPYLADLCNQGFIPFHNQINICRIKILAKNVCGMPCIFSINVRWAGTGN